MSEITNNKKLSNLKCRALAKGITKKYSTYQHFTPYIEGIMESQKLILKKKI